MLYCKHCLHKKATRCDCLNKIVFYAFIKPAYIFEMKAMEIEYTVEEAQSQSPFRELGGYALPFFPNPILKTQEMPCPR